jgi:Outer membrane protein
MKKRNLYLGCLLIAVSGAIQAQSSFTLEQCKELTLKNNYEIRKSELQLKGAEQSRKEAFTNYFPVVSATGTAMNASAGTMNMEMMGTTLSLMKNGVLGGVTATQPVFAGGNIVNGNKLAKVGVEAQRYQLDLSEDEILLQTEQSYYQIVSLQEKLRTLDQLDEMLQHLRRDVENSFKAGLITQNDVLKVKLKQNELASNRLSVENGLDITKKLLCQHMGTDPSGFSITYDSLWMESPANLLVNHAEVLSARNEYKLLDKNVEANNLQLKIKQGEFLPKVAVGAGYMYHNLTDVNTGFSGVVFATVSIPISAWWGGSHAIKKQENKPTGSNERPPE